MATGFGRAPFATVIGDGPTIVRSEFDESRRLQTRSLHTATPIGARELVRQTFGYPHAPPGAPTADGARPSQPTSVRVEHRSAGGDVRATSESFAYDEAGRVVRHEAADGSTVTTEFDRAVPVGRTLPIGLVTCEAVTAADGLVREAGHELNVPRTAVVATETRAGTVGRLDVTARTEYVSEPDGFVSEARAYPAGDRLAVPIVTTRSEWVDAAGGVLRQVETTAAGTAAAATETRTVSLLHGGVLETTDSAGRTGSATTDALGRPTRVTDATGLTVETSYETMQRDGRNATLVALPGGVVTTEQRDALGRVTRLTDNIRDGVATPGFERVAETRTYPAPGVVRVTDAWGATTESMHDVFGRVVRTTTPSGLVHVTEYDDQAGTVTSAITPTGRLDDAELVTSRRTDPNARTSTESGERADGVPTATTTATADGFGRIVTTDDGRARTEVDYDLFGNAARTTVTPRDRGAPPTVVERRFDAFGTSLEKRVADGSSPATGGRRVTDPLGRVVSEADQRGGTRAIEYTVDGRPERVASSAGQVMASDYDALTGRLVASTVTSPVGAAVSTTIEYDEVSGRVRAVADPADPAGSRIAYTYDDFGNVLETRYPDGAVIAHEYDAHGRLSASSDATGRVTTLVYDAAGRLAEVAHHDGEADAPVLARAAYHYDAFDRVDKVELGNGVVTQYTFTSASEIATETTRRGGETLTEREYDYDGTGRLLRRVDRLPRSGPDASSERTTSYRYDHAGRLTGSEVRAGRSEAGPLLRSSAYRLGSAGDVDAIVETTATDDALEVRSREFEYSPVGELVAVTTDGVRAVQEYDPAGNLVRSAAGTTVTYDAANRVRTRTSPDGSTTVTSYWADGTRRALTETGPRDAAGGDRTPSTTTFHWDGAALADERHETDGDPPSVVSYLLGASRHARIATGLIPSTRYLGTDRHGNVTELTDEHGVPVTRYEYTDYGVTTETALGGASTRSNAPAEPVPPTERNPFRYAGEYTDPDGVQPLGQRLYDAGTMRFTTEDPASTEFTRYAYADLNPIMRIDPTGEASAADVTHWAVTALIVAATLATTIVDVATAGTALAVFGIVMLGAADVAVTALDAANQQERFMPESIAMTLGFVIAASGLLTAGMFSKAGKKRARTSEAAVDLDHFAVAPTPLELDRRTRERSVRWQRAHRVADALVESPSLPGAPTVRAGIGMLLEERVDLGARLTGYLMDADEMWRKGWPISSIQGYLAREDAWANLARESAAIGDELHDLAIWQREQLGGFRDLWVWMRWYGLPGDVVDLIARHTFTIGGVELDDYVPVAITKLERLITMNEHLKVVCCAEYFRSTHNWTGRLRSRVTALRALTPASKRY